MIESPEPRVNPPGKSRCFFPALESVSFFSSLFSAKPALWALFFLPRLGFVVEEVRNMMCHHPEILPSSEVAFDLKPTLVFAWQRTNHPRQMERLQDPRRCRVGVDSPTKRIGWITINMDLAAYLIPAAGWIKLVYWNPTFDRGVYTS